MEWSLLEHLGCSYSKIGIKDFIMPRTVWLNIYGLPIIAYNNVTLANLLDKWGEVVSKDVSYISNLNVVNPKICISTSVMEELIDNVKMKIGDDIFNVMIREDRNVNFDYKRSHTSDDHPFLHQENWGNPDTNQTNKDFAHSGSSEEGIPYRFTDRLPEGYPSDAPLDGQSEEASLREEVSDGVFGEDDYFDREEQLKDWNASYKVKEMR